MPANRPPNPRSTTTTTSAARQSCFRPAPPSTADTSLLKCPRTGNVGRAAPHPPAFIWAENILKSHDIGGRVPEAEAFRACSPEGLLRAAWSARLHAIGVRTAGGAPTVARTAMGLGPPLHEQHNPASHFRGSGMRAAPSRGARGKGTYGDAPSASAKLLGALTAAVTKSRRMGRAPLATGIVAEDDWHPHAVHALLIPALLEGQPKGRGHLDFSCRTPHAQDGCHHA